MDRIVRQRLINGAEDVNGPIKRSFVQNDFIHFLSLVSTYKIAPVVKNRGFVLNRLKCEEIPTYHMFIIEIGRYLSVTFVTIQTHSLEWRQRLAGNGPSLKKYASKNHNLHVN